MTTTDEAHRLLITGLLRELPTSDSPSYESDMAKWLRAARTILDLIRVMELPDKTESQPGEILTEAERCKAALRRISRTLDVIPIDAGAARLATECRRIAKEALGEP